MNDVKLSIPSKDLLLQELFKGAASGLGEVLVPVAGNLLVFLFQKLKEDKLYQQTIMAYRQQELQAVQEFSKRSLDLLGEWQKDANQQKNKEIQTLWDKEHNWFSNLNRDETKEILAQEQHRLLILTANPHISPSCPLSFHNNLNIEIRDETARFLSKHYPFSSPNCPVVFYGDYFKDWIRDIDCKRLQKVLGSVPTVVIYSAITDTQVNLKIGFWLLPNTSIVPYHLPPLKWEDMCRIIKEKEKDETKALRIIRQIIVDVHQLLAAFMADWYYLNINHFYEPQLFQLESAFRTDPKPFIEVLQKFYWQNQSELYCDEGLALFKLRHYQEALASFDKAIKLKINYPDALFYRELVLCCGYNVFKETNCCRSQTLSAKGVDYTQLRDFLAESEWEKADQETVKVMLKAAGREKQGWLNVESIDNFPCEDLRTINHLWLHYSDGKFGFSVQKKIYESLGGTKKYNKNVWQDFCVHIGWGLEGEGGDSDYDLPILVFSKIKTSKAHLPGLSGAFGSYPRS